MTLDILNTRFSKPLEDVLFPNPYPAETYNPIHPAVVEFSTPWNGYTRWVANTPYPITAASSPAHDSKLENPSVYASNDGVTWAEPAANPVVAALGGTDYNADSELFYDAVSDKLVLLWRETTTAFRSLKAITTSDGVTWSAQTILIQAATGTNQDYATPSMMVDGDGKYRIYTINGDAVATEKPVQYITSSALLTGWTAPTTVAAFPVPSNTWWNMYVKYVEGEYVGFIQDAIASGSAGDLYTLKSTDGTNFTTQLVYPSSAFYRCCFSTLAVVENGQSYYTAYLSGFATGQYIRKTAISFNATQAEVKRVEVNALEGANDTAALALPLELLTVDDFERTDATWDGVSNNNFSPEAGFGSWQLLDGRARLTEEANRKLVYDVGQSDILMRIQFGAVADGEQWAVIRYQDTNNYLRIGHDGSADLKLQVVSGGVTPYDYIFLDTISDFEELEIRAIGDEIQVELLTTGGVSFVTNATFNTATAHGVQSRYSAQSFGYLNIIDYDGTIEDRYVLDLLQLPDPTTALTGAKGSIGSPTRINTIPQITGLSASVIGVGTNSSQSAAGRVLSVDQAANHVVAVIGGDDADINVSELEVTTYNETGSTGKHIRYETATAPVAPDGAFPNTYLNKTDPAVTVGTDESAFSVEP